MSFISNHKAFSVVEIVIVIAVIGILATITLIAYPQVQSNAKDQKIKEGASKVVSAIEEWSIRGDSISPSTVGWGRDSTIDYGYGTKAIAQCVGGNPTQTSWIATNKANCTLEDVLVRSDFLQKDFLANLPQNNKTGKVDELYRIKQCQADKNDFVLLYALNSPTTKDKDNYQSLGTSCGIDSGEQSMYGMNGALQFEINE